MPWTGTGHRGAGHGDVAPARQRHGRHGLGHFEGEGGEIRLLRGLHRQRFELGHLEQLLHQAAHAGHILAQRRRDGAITQRVEMGGENGQRRAELMGGIGREVPLGPEALVEAIEGGVDRPHQRRQLARQVGERQAPLAHRRRDPGRRAREALQGPKSVAQGQRADDEPRQQCR